MKCKNLGRAVLHGLTTMRDRFLCYTKQENKDSAHPEWPAHTKFSYREKFHGCPADAGSEKKRPMETAGISQEDFYVGAAAHHYE